MSTRVDSLEGLNIHTCRVSVRPRAALATMLKRGTEEMASDVALTTLRALMTIPRVSLEEDFRFRVRARGTMLIYCRRRRLSLEGARELTEYDGELE